MTDERFAEWFEEAAQAGWPDAADFLAEMRDAGFEIFRPEDCGPVLLMSLMTQTFVRCEREDAQYLLVPVGGED